MNLITPTALARLIKDDKGNELTKQAAHEAVKEGIIPHILKGKKKLVDLDDPNVQAYIKDNNRQREQVKKNEIKPSKKKAKKPQKKIKTSRKQPENKQKNNLPSANRDKKLYELKMASDKAKNKIDTSKFENLDPFEMKRRAQFADMRKRELQVLVMEKKYLPIDFIDGVYIKYIETLNSTIERLSSTYINDVGKKILEAGEVLPEHIEKFNSFILEAIHNNKKDIKRIVKNYEPHL